MASTRNESKQDQQAKLATDGRIQGMTLNHQWNLLKNKESAVKTLAAGLPQVEIQATTGSYLQDYVNKVLVGDDCIADFNKVIEAIKSTAQGAYRVRHGDFEHDALGYYYQFCALYNVPTFQAWFDRWEEKVYHQIEALFLSRAAELFEKYPERSLSLFACALEQCSQQQRQLRWQRLESVLPYVMGVISPELDCRPNDLLFRMFAIFRIDMPAMLVLALSTYYDDLMHRQESVSALVNSHLLKDLSNMVVSYFKPDCLMIHNQMRFVAYFKNEVGALIGCGDVITAMTLSDLIVQICQHWRNEAMKLPSGDASTSELLNSIDKTIISAGGFVNGLDVALPSMRHELMPKLIAAVSHHPDKKRWVELSRGILRDHAEVLESSYRTYTASVLSRVENILIGSCLNFEGRCAMREAIRMFESKRAPVDLLQAFLVEIVRLHNAFRLIQNPARARVAYFFQQPNQDQDFNKNSTDARVLHELLVSVICCDGQLYLNNMLDIDSPMKTRFEITKPYAPQKSLTLPPELLALFEAHKKILREIQQLMQPEEREEKRPEPRRKL